MTLFRRIVIFLLVGGMNSLLDFIFYTVVTTWILPGGGQIILAGLVSGTVALVIAYLSHRYITWREKHVPRSAVIRFFVATGFGMWVIRPFLLWLFSKPTSVSTAIVTLGNGIGVHLSLAFVRNTVAFLAMTVIVVVYNFVMYQRFVFVEAKPESDADAGCGPITGDGTGPRTR